MTPARRLTRALTATAALIAVAAPAAAATSPGTVALAGSAPPAVAGTPLGALPGGGTVDAIVYLKPRHPAALARAAAAAGGRRPMSREAIRRRFLPSPATVSRTAAYLRSRGLSVRIDGRMALAVRGSAAAAEHAFGLTLGRFRDSRGGLFTAPEGPVRLPASVAPAVRTVAGLDTGQRLLPAAAGGPAAAPVTPSCAGARRGQRRDGGYQPDQLAAAYGLDGLQRAPNGDLGAGETIGLVEFSAYRAHDITVYRNCFAAGTFTGSITDVAVSGGTTDLSGELEAELDIEVAAAAAPAARLRVYEAPNSLSQVPLVIDAMRGAGVTVASDSWGICEPLANTGLLAAENDALQLAAVSGMSFFASAGDNGASDCRAADGSLTPAVDDPASQPFATGVGGTVLSAYRPGSPPARTEAVWHSGGGAGGGGVSVKWTQPVWQAAVAPRLPGRCTNSSAVACREVPDVSLDAAPATGYVVYCGCDMPPWATHGGTSAAAPLMAAIAAVADEYSLGHGGRRLGYANPFLYHEAAADPSMFADITVGNNNVGAGGYAAVAGYDPVSGIGSVNALQMARDLAAYSPSPPSIAATRITLASSPAAGSVVVYPGLLRLSGTLATPAGLPIAHAPVHVVSSYGSSYRATTGSGAAAGRWSIAIRPLRSATWTAVYAGSGDQSPSHSRGRAIGVRPLLTNGAALPRDGGGYRAVPGRRFVLSGWSGPNMHGATILLQRRRLGGRRWAVVSASVAGRYGGYRAIAALPSAATYEFRWVFVGGPGRRWATTASRVVDVAG